MNLEGHTQPAEVQAIYDHYKAQRKNDFTGPIWAAVRLATNAAGRCGINSAGHGLQTLTVACCACLKPATAKRIAWCKNLKAIVVIEVWEVDPETGKQIHASAHGGHFGLSLDGVVRGLKDKQPACMMFECKTIEHEDGFKQLKAKGVQEAKPIYWSQMQVGMHLCDLDRALFVTVCKADLTTIYMERVRLDKDRPAVKLVAKAGQVIFATNEPPAKLNEVSVILRFASFAAMRRSVMTASCHVASIAEPAPMSRRRADRDMELPQRDMVEVAKSGRLQ